MAVRRAGSVLACRSAPGRWPSAARPLAARAPAARARALGARRVRAAIARPGAPGPRGGVPARRPVCRRLARRLVARVPLRGCAGRLFAAPRRAVVARSVAAGLNVMMSVSWRTSTLITNDTRGQNGQGPRSTRLHRLSPPKTPFSRRWPPCGPVQPTSRPHLPHPADSTQAPPGTWTAGRAPCPDLGRFP